MTVISSGCANHRTPSTVVFADANAQLVLATSFSTTVSMGTADASRVMIALIYAHNGALTAGTLVDSCTLAGVAMTNRGTFDSTTGWQCFDALIPTGTSGTISMTHSSGTGAFFGFTLFAAYHLKSMALSDSSFSRNNSASLTVAVPFQGVAMAMANTDDAAGTITMGGDFSQDFQGSPAGFAIGAATLTKQLPAGTRAGNYVATYTGGGVGGGVAVAFS